MHFVEIDGQKIGEEFPVRIICEIGLNHQGSLGTAKKMIDIASSLGIDFVKFQMRDLNALYRKQDLLNPNLKGQGFVTIVEWLKKIDVSNEFYFDVYEHCISKGIKFLCSPFDIPSAQFLEHELGVSAYKIGSPCMSDIFLLKEIISYKKPIIISTGMHHLDEIDKVVSLLKANDSKFILMHCVSNYPTKFPDLKLRYITLFKERYGVPIGFSSHSYGVVASVVAMALGACMIEHHFTLDRTAEGPDHRSSFESRGMQDLVERIKRIEQALKPLSESKVNIGELTNKEVLVKSLVAKEEIRKGEIITEDNLTAKVYGYGMSPLLLDSILYKRASVDICRDDFIDIDMIEE